MTFAEAKRRSDYRFWTNTIDVLRHQIINKEFDYFDEYDERNGVFETGVACLELGYVDIELNVSADSDDGKYINSPCTAYFLCVKGGEDGEEWGEAGYLDDFGIEVDVDWESQNWQRQLEEDMFRKLMIAVDALNLKTDEPNWKTDEFEVFNRIYNNNKTEV